MDPSQVATYITPLLAVALNEGVKGAGGQAGKATAEVGGRALRALRGWRRKSPQVNTAIGGLVVEPDSAVAREALREALHAFLAEEPELLAQLAGIVGVHTIDQRQTVSIDQRRGTVFIDGGTFNAPIAGRDVHQHGTPSGQGPTAPDADADNAEEPSPESDS